MLQIPSTRPYFPEADIKTILKNTETALRSGRFFGGPFGIAFERAFAKIAGTRYAVATNSATSALEIALSYYGAEGGEVITTVNTFIATPNAILFAGGTPVLADIHPETLCMDPEDAERKITPKTKGIILVHLGGLITPHVEKIRAIAKKHKLFLIEDAAHAHGASRGGKPAGSWGNAAAFSFFATKVITTGGFGGMLTTNDKKLAERARSVRFHGEDKKRGIQDRLGSNRSLSEVQAIVGLTQTARLPEIVKKRMTIARVYSAAFAKLPGVTTFPLFSKTVHSYYKYLLLLEPPLKKERVAAALKKRGVATGSLYWPPVHLQPVYRKKFGYKPGDFPVAEDILSRAISLPMHAGLTKKERDYCIAQVKRELHG